MKILQSLVLACVLQFNVAFSSNSGPVGYVKIESFGKCDPDINDIEYEIKIYTTEEDVKAIDLKLNLPNDVDEDVRLRITVDKWENNDWQKDFYETEAGLFELLNKYLETIYNNIRNSIEPKIENPDFIPKDIYELNKFIDFSENIDIPQIFYGRFKVYFTIIVDGEEVACLLAEGESFQ